MSVSPSHAAGCLLNGPQEKMKGGEVGVEGGRVPIDLFKPRGLT